MADGQWYYCLDHHAVEPYLGCKSGNRLGPYATQGEAAVAVERVNARNEEWFSDPAWVDPEDLEKPLADREDSPFGL